MEQICCPPPAFALWSLGIASVLTLSFNCHLLLQHSSTMLIEFKVQAIGRKQKTIQQTHRIFALFTLEYN